MSSGSYLSTSISGILSSGTMVAMVKEILSLSTSCWMVNIIISEHSGQYQVLMMLGCVWWFLTWSVSVHSWLHLCIDLDLKSGLVSLTVNGRLVGANIQMSDWSPADNMTLSHLVLGENNSGKWNGDHGHRSLIGNINFFSGNSSSASIDFTLNPCQTEGDLLR